jgi:hypothetical protein
MRRWLLIGALALVSVSTAQMALGAAAPTTTTRAALQTFGCHPALRAAKRSVSVTAVMRPVSGTQHMQMRFQLLSDALGRLAPVRGGDLGTWISPRPSTLGQDPKDVWIVRHPVTKMAVPANYRFKVSFRWTGADHRTITTAVRLSPICNQPDMRPDLLVQSITVNSIAGDTTENQYVAQIANNGLTAATAFDVLFAPGDGSATQSASILKLAAHATRTEAFVGPACTTATAPTITVDPEHHVNDLDRANNSLTATCPSVATASRRG